MTVAHQKFRQSLSASRRVVIKIGSRVIVQASGRPDTRRIRRLVADIAAARKAGYEIVVVSSGAIAAGMEALGLRERPTAVSELQMCAAVGQGRLISGYADLFGKARLLVGQVLLTHDDFTRKVNVTNLRRTMDRLLQAGVIPIVNENDVVADEEVKADMSLGDNDYLASLVVRQIRADLLVILSTTDGLKDMSVPGRPRRIPLVEAITAKTFRLVAPVKGTLSKGGMDSKLRAAQSCARAGCAVVIANGRQNDVLASILSGHDTGTLFLA
ncbi:MAG: glutamate 5-kinase [Kiritimatiellaeota bacterium]|nr:glutamate 5-kinase [Kiritimatiellota bacterium]